LWLSTHAPRMGMDDFYPPAALLSIKYTIIQCVRTILQMQPSIQLRTAGLRR